MAEGPIVLFLLTIEMKDTWFCIWAVAVRVRRRNGRERISSKN